MSFFLVGPPKKNPSFVGVNRNLQQFFGISRPCKIFMCGVLHRKLPPWRGREHCLGTCSLKGPGEMRFWWLGPRNFRNGDQTWCFVFLMVFFSVSNYGVILGNVNFQGMYFQGVHLEILENHRLIESADSRGWSSFDSCNLFKTAGFPKLKVPPRNLTQIYQQLPIFERESPFPNHQFWVSMLVFGATKKKTMFFFLNRKKKTPPGIDRNVLKWGTTGRNLMPGFNDNSLVWQRYPRWFILFLNTKIEFLYLKTVGERGGWRWRALTGKTQFLLFRMLPCCFCFVSNGYVIYIYINNINQQSVISIIRNFSVFFSPLPYVICHIFRDWHRSNDPRRGGLRLPSWQRKAQLPPWRCFRDIKWEGLLVWLCDFVFCFYIVVYICWV